jgi:hypothetical protein
MERGGLGWTEIQTQADDNLSRFSSYSNATIAEASTTLSVTVFADEPRRFVPSREIEARDPGDDFVNPQPTWRRRSLVDQRLNSPCRDRWLALARSRSRLTWSSGTLLIERSKINSKMEP